MLTQEQIEFLFSFCEKKGVRYYDLQVELVDHLSEAIEIKIDEDPTLSFDAALMQVYKGFGITGFSRVVQDKETAVLKNYRKSKWKYFKAFLTWNKMAITLLLLFLLNLPAFAFNLHNFALYYTLLTAAAVVFGLVLVLFSFKTFKKPRKKIMALKNYGWGFGILGTMLQVPNFYYFFLRGFDVETDNNIWLHAAISCFVVFLVLLSLAEYYAYKNTYADLKKQYPSAFANA